MVLMEDGKMNYICNYYDYMIHVSTLNRKKRAREDPDFVYYELHHIMPRSIYPDLASHPENVVLLTAREHFLAHYLLTKIYSNGIEHQKMVYAFAAFQRGRNKNVMNCGGIVYNNSRLWAKSREEFAILVGISKSGNNKSHQMAGEHHWNTGRKYSEESKKKMSDRAKNRPSPMKGRHHSPETLEKLRILSTGRPQSEETRRKRSESLKGKTKGRKMSEGARKKQSESALRRFSRITPWFYCIETGVEFKTLKDAAKYCGKSYMKKELIDDPNRSVGGFHFATIQR